jgi:anti-sigma B factor antagonist
VGAGGLSVPPSYDPLMLRADVGEVDGCPVVSLVGRVDVSTVPVLQNALVRAISSGIGRVVAVDLDGLDGLDDAGIGILIGAAGRARGSGGDVVLVCTRDALLRRFAVTRLDQAVTIVPNTAAIPR